MSVKKLLDKNSAKGKIYSVCIYNHNKTEVFLFTNDDLWKDKEILDDLLNRYGRKGVAAWVARDSNEKIGYLDITIHLI